MPGTTATIKKLPSILLESFKVLGENDPLRLAGATAFFSTFALPPILIILIQVLGLVFNRRSISDQLFDRLTQLIGSNSVDQIIVTLHGFRHLAQNWYITIGGFIFLVFVATTLFKVIKSSVNQIWKIRTEAHRNVKNMLRSRLQSVIVILAAGLLFLAGLFVESAQALLGKYLNEFWQGSSSILNSALNPILSVIIVTTWFAVLFRYLPDARSGWKVCIAGGLVTALLFSIGKYLLSWLLTYSNISTLYGASGSIVLLLLFVFYSSFILYYGVSFTKLWAEYSDQPIKPLPYASSYELQEIEIE